MIDFTDVAFGRKPHSPERNRQAKQHKMSAESPAPLILPRKGILTAPSLVLNNRLPTCTMAGLINSLRCWAQVQGFDLPTNNALLLELFASIAGCANTEDAIAATDGLVMIDVLEHIQTHGFNIGLEAPVELSFTNIDIGNLAGIKDAIFRNASAYVGITLYQADVQPGVTKWAGGLTNAGPVAGGHCVAPKGWPQVNLFDVATWGGEMPTDEAFFASRLEEAFDIEWKMAVAPVVA